MRGCKCVCGGVCVCSWKLKHQWRVTMKICNNKSVTIIIYRKNNNINNLPKLRVDGLIWSSDGRVWRRQAIRTTTTIAARVAAARTRAEGEGRLWCPQKQAVCRRSRSRGRQSHTSVNLSTLMVWRIVASDISQKTTPTTKHAISPPFMVSNCVI